MKKLIFISLFIISNSVFANNLKNELIDQINSEVVEAVLRTHHVELAKKDLSLLPDSLKCIIDNNEYSLKELTNYDLTYKSDEKKMSILIDWSDGDQVGGLFVTTKALRMLSLKEIESIPAKIYEGYWWADGDHYKLTNAECHL